MIIKTNPEFGVELVLTTPYAYHNRDKVETIITSKGMKPFYYWCDDVREEFDNDGKKTVVIICKANRLHVKDFIKEVEDAVEASETDLEKERIYRKYSGQEDYCLLKSGLLNNQYFFFSKNKLDHSYINALKAKGYYRGDN